MAQGQRMNPEDVRGLYAISTGRVFFDYGNRWSASGARDSVKVGVLARRGFVRATEGWRGKSVEITAKGLEFLRDADVRGPN